MKLLSRLFPSRRSPVAHALYGALVEQSRRPEFYLHAGIPDTLDGRFEMLSLHAFLVLRGLKRDSTPAARTMGEQLVEIMFSDMDQTLREMGVGDLGVGKRVKLMASSFYGRVAAYDAGLATGAPHLEEALRRNLFGTGEAADEAVDRMAAYLRREAQAFENMEINALLAGRIVFGPPPGPVP